MPEYLIKRLEECIKKLEEREKSEERFSIISRILIIVMIVGFLIYFLASR